MNLKPFGKLLAIGLVAATWTVPALSADYTLSVNTALTTADPLYKGLEAFRDGVAKRTDGKVEIKLFPNSQLGADNDVLEQARAGAPVAVVSDGGRLANYVHEFGVLGAPFLASGYDGIRKVVTSDLFEGWVKKLHDKAQLQVLSFNWWQGQRQLLTNKPIKTPADLNGVRMRTPDAPVWLETIKAMGATPTPLPWSEVYNAVQQHVIDAAEAQQPAVLNAKLFEVLKYMTKTGHINLITGLIASAGWFDSLPAEDQKIVREEALKAGDIASYGTRDAISKIEDELKADGMIINDVDTTPFRKATAVVYDKLGYGDLRDKLRAMAAQ